jgi:hypothetical protein
MARDLVAVMRDIADRRRPAAKGRMTVRIAERIVAGRPAWMR